MKVRIELAHDNWADNARHTVAPEVEPAL
jgi:hypothetical protein